MQPVYHISDRTSRAFLDVSGQLVPVNVVQVVDSGPGGRKDECSAYLSHLIWASGGGDPGDYTAFLQADAFRHVHPQLFHLVMRSLRHGTLDVPFVHLSRARMVASSSPCKRAIYQQVTGRPPSSIQVSAAIP